MLLAINYSFQAAALLDQNRIQIDRFKCPDWPEMIEEASQFCQVAIHLNLKAGRGNLINKNWERISRLLEETGTPFVNLHLETREGDIPGIPLDTNEPHHSEQIVERMVTDLKIVIHRFGAERVIAENVPYRGVAGKVLRPSVDPKVIQQVLEETNCGLLLDISHAKITAHYLGMDERSYITRLPVERMRELHFTGVHNLNGYLQDHLEALEEDWMILKWVLDNIRTGNWPRPWMVAFEYGGVGEKFATRSDPKIIAEQTPQLYSLVRTV